MPTLDSRFHAGSTDLARPPLEVHMQEAQTTASEENDGLRPFFYSIDEIPGYTIADMYKDRDPDAAAAAFDLFGRDLITKVILRSPGLSVFHSTAKPGERVKPHRHGTHQINFILRGELIYGNRRTTAGMGYFNPNMLYSWTAGPEGAEWIEIHAGEPGTYTDRPK
jgi:hypothetical protein